MQCTRMPHALQTTKMNYTYDFVVFSSSFSLSNRSRYMNCVEKGKNLHESLNIYTLNTNTHNKIMWLLDCHCPSLYLNIETLKHWTFHHNNNNNNNKHNHQKRSSLSPFAYSYFNMPLFILLAKITHLKVS